MAATTLARRYVSEFAADVREGLAKPQKELLSKYLYDDVGSALFEVISVLPEYGLTRADERFEIRLKPALRDESRHHRAADYCGQQDRVLALVDDVIGQAEQGRN